MTIDELLARLADDTPPDPEGLRAVLSDILQAALDFSANHIDGVSHVAIHLAAGAVWAKGQYDEATTQEMLSYLSEIAAYLVDEGLSPETRTRLETIRNTSAQAT
jgi:hypothetical protein